MSINIDFIRRQFPGLSTDWILMDNAGGSQIAQPVLEKLNDYLIHSNAQLGASYEISDVATRRVQGAHQRLARFINAADPGEVLPGSSTSMLIRILADNMKRHLPYGSEIIVTNCDHEANIGAWRELREEGFIIKTWEVNLETWELELDQLGKLMNEDTRLVAFTHTSNILGKINPVKEITRYVHDRGAMVCVDGVAYAPHRPVDVQDLDVDFYAFSFYKTFGPHYAMLYGKKEHLLALPGNNHYFIGQEETAYKFLPGNVNYELTWAATGIIDYYDSIAAPSILADHEEELSKALLSFLETKNSVRIIGPTSWNKQVRVPTISFVVENTDSQSIVLQTDQHKIGIRYGDFYAARLIDSLNLRAQNGVVRVSMVHYNTLDEVNHLIRVLDRILP